MANAQQDEQSPVSTADAPEGPIEDIGNDEIADLDTAIETLRLERDEMRDRFMRALADAENARKRGEKDRREAEQGTRLGRFGSGRRWRQRRHRRVVPE